VEGGLVVTQWRSAGGGREKGRGEARTRDLLKATGLSPSEEPWILLLLAYFPCPLPPSPTGPQWRFALPKKQNKKHRIVVLCATNPPGRLKLG
jgi:hypothetical protein